MGGLGSLVGAASLTGCTFSNPTIDPPSAGSGLQTGSAIPAPSGATSAPPSGYPQVAGQEQNLAELARAVGRRKGVSGDQRRLLELMVAAHADHARVLASPDPAARPSTTTPIKGSSPALSGVSTKDAVKRLAAAENKLAGRHRKAAVEARGLTALLWGSLAVAAEGFATVSDAAPPPAGALRAHRPMALLDDVAAVQQVIAQLHAIIWGYQLAVGKLAVASKARPRALTRLLRHRVLRDRLISWLVKRSADVPAAKAAYVPSTSPTDAGSASKLIRGMETAFLPFCGLWLAAAGTRADRQLALNTLRSAASTARTWGAGARAWPGWSD